jgi:hypothetical protein
MACGPFLHGGSSLAASPCRQSFPFKLDARIVDCTVSLRFYISGHSGRSRSISARLISQISTGNIAMRKQFGQMHPHWLDEAIESSWRDHDPRSIATAISSDNRLIAAIRQGLEDARRLPERQPGLSHAQCIRNAVLEAMEG